MFFHPIHSLCDSLEPSLQIICRGQLKCDCTRTETIFRLPAKRTSPFKSAGGRQFSRLLAAEVCASAVVTLESPCSAFRQCPLHFPQPCLTVYHHISTAVYPTDYKFKMILNEKPFLYTRGLQWQFLCLFVCLQRYFLRVTPRDKVKVVGCQPYAPAAFNPRYLLVLISVRGW